MKKNSPSGYINKTAFLFLLSVITFGCNRERDTTGWDYFPDMFVSTAYETFTTNPNFEDGITMRVPAAGTIPRGFIPFDYTIDSESRIKAGKELINPYISNNEIITKGQVVYSTFCMDCHGISGKGDGHLFSAGLYPMQPRDLTGDEVKGLKDGEIYHTITLGFGSMGAHGSQIRPNDRWKLLLYIRMLQKESGSTSEIKKEENK